MAVGKKVISQNGVLGTNSVNDVRAKLHSEVTGAGSSILVLKSTITLIDDSIDQSSFLPNNSSAEFR